MTANDLWWYAETAPHPPPGTEQTINFGSMAVTGDGLFANVGVATVPETLPIPGVPSSGSGFQVKLVDKDGSEIATLPNANVADITWTLNDSTTASFKSSKHDPATALVSPVVTEAQIVFNGDLLFFGPILTRSASSGDGEVSFAARGADWFLTRRQLAMPPVVPLLPNGLFRNGMAGWTPRMVDGATATIVNRPTLAYGQALQIVWNQSAAYKQMFIHGVPVVTATFPTDAPFIGVWTVEAWCQIVRLDDPVSGVLLSLDGTGSGGTRGDVVIPSEYEAGKWFKLTTSAYSAPGSGAMKIDLFAVDGTIVWDAVRVYLDGPYGAGLFYTDTAAMANLAVVVSQQLSDVNLGVQAATSGVYWPEATWPVHEHTRWSQIVDAIRDYGAGFDWSVEVTPGTRTWTPHVPKKGQVREVTLKLGAPSDGGTIATYSWADDGSTLTNTAIVQGDGPDGTKTEAGWVNLGLFDGIELDSVAQADEGVPLGDLDRLAEQFVDESATADDQLSVKCHNANYDFTRDVDTGDTVTVDIVDGAVTVDGTWRIIEKKLNGADLTVDLTLVRS